MKRNSWIVMMDDGWVHGTWFKTRALARAQALIYKTSPYYNRNKVRVVKVLR